MQKEHIAYIREHVSAKELLCQLAEEASELAQAALKLRRTYDDTNPTPVTQEEALSNLKEELADVRLALRILGINYDDAECEPHMQVKLTRWIARLESRNQQDPLG